VGDARQNRSADSPSDGLEQGPRGRAPDRLTGSVVVVALVSAISGLLYGYDTGIISGALLQIGEDFDIGSGWEQVIAASILVGAVIGALTCSWLAEHRGRRARCCSSASCSWPVPSQQRYRQTRRRCR
jgi:hypothetical protein